MPHIAVKLRKGYSRARKVRLSDALARAIVATLDCPYFDVSIAIDDVLPAEWFERVHVPEILGKSNAIYKEPGCGAGRATIVEKEGQTHA